jgi:hypothetical protein
MAPGITLAGGKRKSDEIEQRFVESSPPFDSLDDRLLGQTLLRCGTADWRPLTATCRASLSEGYRLPGLSPRENPRRMG